VTALLTTGNAVGILIIIVLWATFVTLLGVAIGRKISRRK
jgi:hypothetical protein